MKPVPLIEADDESSYGGKAVSLGAALRAGLPVPPGFALPVALVDAVAGDERDAHALASGLLGQIDGPVAVRSSAVGEDSAAASFAGQHKTILNARTSPALVAAVREVWQSGRSEAALAYRRKLGVTGEPRIAVLVQRLVHPDCAGVLFTRNPTNGADELVIEASWGLGEAVVAGLVTPDFYRVSRTGVLLERTVGDKDLAIQPLPDGGTQETEVPEAQRAGACLDDGQLAALNELALRCESHFGRGQDIEWAFTGATLYLLQARPITRSSG